MISIKSIYLNNAVMPLYIGITTFVLSRFAMLIQPVLSIRYDWTFELSMVLGQLIFQLPYIYRKPLSLKIMYYKNMIFVSFMGALLLIPLLLMNEWYSSGIEINILYFLIIVVIMFFEHKRRVQKLALPIYVCYTWITYRIIILFFII